MYINLAYLRFQVFQFGGSGLLTNYYGQSVYAALKAVYPGEFSMNFLATKPPEFPFLAFRFKNSGVPKGHWNDIENVREFLSYVAKKVNVQVFIEISKFICQKLDDWHNITTASIINNGGVTLLMRYGGWLQVVAIVGITKATGAFSGISTSRLG